MYIADEKNEVRKIRSILILLKCYIDAALVRRHNHVKI